jgi:hypothetical protein
MNLRELKIAYKIKTVELDLAMEHGRPREELLKLYKELKRLQYNICQAELSDHSMQAIPARIERKF